VLRIVGDVDSAAVCAYMVERHVGSVLLSDCVVDRFDTVYVVLAVGRSYDIVGPVLNNPQ
jgi:hypothetical protein